MSTTVNTTDEVTEQNVKIFTKPKIYTCYIYYSDQEELSKIFEAINNFRKSHNLKYTHHTGYIFFNLSQDALGEFSKIRPFSISKYQTKSEFSCSKEVGEKIVEKRNSFIKILWNEETKTINFFSRTLSWVHNSLVYKIFKECEIEFSRSSYKYTKNCGEIEPESESRKTKNTLKPRESNKNNKTEESSDNSGFIKVENKKNKDTNNKKSNQTSYKDRLKNTK